MTPKTYYDATLVDVIDDAPGFRLLVTIGGAERSFRAQYAPFTDCRGLRGVIREDEAQFCRFEPYQDQTLERAPELDRDDQRARALGQVPNVVGWRCAREPGGFLAPVGLIPGENGRFVPDRSSRVILQVPGEFEDLCARYGLTPADLLHGFMADAAALHNYIREPRADGLSSHGSDERDMADSYIERAHAMRREDAEALEEAMELEREREDARDELLDLVIDFEASGGSLDAIRVVLAGMVASQSAASRSDGDDPDAAGDRT